MRAAAHIAVIIPALNEAASLPRVIREIPAWVRTILVADNGSTDGTPDAALAAAAESGRALKVVCCRRPGYGAACQAAMAHLPAADVVVFLDGDCSDHPAQMDRLVDPILAGAAEIVIGSRMLGDAEPGSLSPQQRWGNALATRLIRALWGARFTDLGPFRAVRASTLWSLAMADPDWGWTAELQVKAARDGIAFLEVPVDYRRRIGRSKISGTVRGVLAAGSAILGTIARARLGLGRWATCREGNPPPCRDGKLILFTKLPEAGRTKTRLIPALGAQGAADLHQRMMLRTIRVAGDFCRAHGLHFELRLSGGEGCELCHLIRGPRFTAAVQGPGDLGDRQRRATRAAFREGFRRVLVVGADTPGLDAAALLRAHEALAAAPVALHPVADGGYCLLGLARPVSPLFDGIEWGGPAVAEGIRRNAAALGLPVAELGPVLRDVDNPGDIEIWESATGERVERIAPEAGARQAEMHRPHPFISVVIPALNEAGHLRETLISCRDPHIAEVIVVDGGSADGTVALARSMGARVINGTRGRARQMNAGAAAATQDTLLFLHADTTLPDNAGWAVRETLDQPGTAAGAFKFRIRGGDRRHRLIDKVTHLRARYLQRPYGDQGLFLTRKIFDAAGGYPDQPLMDDFLLVRELQKLGRVRIAPVPAVTSARRWRRLGPFRTTLTNQLILILHALGVPPERLARIYHARPIFPWIKF